MFNSDGMVPIQMWHLYWFNPSALKAAWWRSPKKIGWGYVQRTGYGVGSEILCKRLNHSSPVITMRYLCIEDKEVQNILMNVVMWWLWDLPTSFTCYMRWKIIWITVAPLFPFFLLVFLGFKRCNGQRHRCLPSLFLLQYNDYFRSVPVQVDRMLKENGNIWFSSERNIEVIIEVDRSCASYFRRRKVYPIRRLKRNGWMVLL